MSEFARKPSYTVRFDRTGASYVDRNELLSDPLVKQQMAAGRRIVQAYRERMQPPPSPPAPEARES